MADLQFSHRSNGFKSQSNDVSATVTGKIANGNGYSGKNGYGDVFGGPPKFTVPSFASDIDEYSEIFRSFSDSRNCSVPFLEFPVHDGENIEVSGGSLSSTFAYSDIFGSFDGDVVVPYEDLFGEPKGSRNQCRVPPDSKEKGFSGEISSKNIWNPVETKSCHQSPTVVPSVSLEEPNTEAFASLEKNSFSASVASDHLQDGVKQVNMPSPKTSQRNIEDAIDGTSHICQTYTVSGFTSDTCAPLRNTVSDQTLPPVIDDLSLNADFSEEILEEKHTRKPMPPNPASNNFLKPLLGSKSTAVEEAPYASNQWHSHDSPHDLTSGGDKHNSNGTFLTVSDINLRTKPTRVPPPTRLPPKLVTKWGASEKMMAANLKASGVKEDLHEPEMINQHHQFGGGAETCIVEEVSSQSSPPFLDVEIDASSAAAASAAAMKEAMERAEARIKSAKHSMEKKRDIKGRENGGIKGRERMGCPIAEENHRNKEHTAWEVGEGEDRGTKDRIRDERRKAVKTAQVAPDVQERERKLELAQESMERKLVKDLGVGRDAHEQGNKAGEWKAGKKFYEWEETEKKFKAAEDFFELGKKEKKLNAATEDCKHEASEKKLVAAKENHEHGENVNEFKAAKDALEHEEYEKRLKASVDARQQEENEKRLKAAQVAREREESEKKLKATQEAQEREENEKKLKLAQEACELEENRRKLKLAQEAREREENERKLKLAQEVREQEENERKLKLAEAREWEEKERKLKLAQEAREQEESDKKLKLAQEACEREENERKLKLAEEAREREENERKLKLAQETRELEENERRLKLVQEAREREENEWKLKVAQEACEWEENERKLKLVQGTHEREENERKLKFAQKACEWEENERMLKLAQEPREREGNEWKLKQAQEDSEQEEHERKIKLAQETHESDENVWKLKLAQEDSKLDENEKKLGVAQRVSVWEEKNGIPKPFQEFCKSEGTDRKVKTIDEAHEIEEHKKEQQEKMKVQQEREQEKERLRKIEEEKEREREREKDRLAVERATREARERAFVEARERAERASAEARERASMEARLRVERAAVDRATAEARERAMERVLAEKAAMEARERAERSIAERFAAALRDRQRKGNDPGEFVGNCTRTNGGMRQNPASEFEHDLQFQSTIPSNGSYQRNSDATNYGLHSIEKFQEAEGELSMRHKAKLERQHRTDERAAKALSEKKLRDILAQREQAERNRLAETLDADVRRWSMGKAGNLRALLSTLQYILWPESGWQPVPLTDVITAAAVKKAYRKATLCVHPDKVQQRGASIQQKYISEKVFDLLKEAWNKFNSEER